MPTEAPALPASIPGPLQRALHMFAMTQVAVAYPVYDLLSRFPEFFVARQAQPADIWLFVLALSLFLPAALVSVTWLGARIDRRLGWAMHLGLIAGLSLLLGLSVSSRMVGPLASAVSSVAFCAALTAAYWRTRAGPLFLTFLAPAIVVVPAFFLLHGEIAQLVRPPEAVSSARVSEGVAETPVVFLVFDELPTFALLDGSGGIDAARYPNIAALASTAYWFPNATTVATGTILAVPPMLTGRFPVRFAMPHHGEYPDNLFTWLGADYDLNVQEAVSALCPKKLCGGGRIPHAATRLGRLLLDVSAVYGNIVASGLLPGRLPIVTQSWKNFWSPARSGSRMYEHRLNQLADFVDRIQVTERPGLEFMHVNFPHIPYEYLPSGRRYAEGWVMPGLDFASDTWTGSKWQTTQAYRRFVLQVQALDRWLGTLIDRLRGLGLYDRSIIVLTADHGVAFAPDASRRDTPPLENLERSILPVPLIIKAPRQSAGVVSRRNAETIDILPTLAELLGRPLPWSTDGVSLLGAPKSDAKRAVHRYKELALFETSAAQVESAIRQALRAADDPIGGDPAARTLEQARRELVGRKPSELPATRAPEVAARLPDPGHFRDVRPSSGFLPAHVTGTIESRDAGPILLALALNGRIEAITPTYSDGSGWRFSAMLPESSFRPGDNRLQLFGIESTDAGQPVLFAIDLRADDPRDRWALDGEKLLRDGVHLPVDAQGIQGRLDYISPGDDSLELLGWAIDAAERRTVGAILIFDRGRLVYRGETRMLREETHQFGVVLRIGFHAVIPAEDGRRGDLAAGVRVFAVTDDGRTREIRVESGP